MDISEYDGYGIELSSLTVRNPEDLKIFIMAHCPDEFAEDMLKLNENATVDEILAAVEDCPDCGLAEIFQYAMEQYGVDVECCAGFSPDAYVYYTPKFPWMMKENEKSWTEEDLRRIFCKLASELSDDEPNVGLQVIYHDLNI